MTCCGPICGTPLAAPQVASLCPRTKLARVHVLDHAPTQRADGIRTHEQLLSWMRLKTPRSSRQGATLLSAMSNLVNTHPDKPPLSHSDLVLWPRAGVAGFVRALPELE